MRLPKVNRSEGSGRRQGGYAAAQPTVPTETDLTLGVSLSSLVGTSLKAQAKVARKVNRSG